MRTLASLFAVWIAVLFIVGCAATYPDSQVSFKVETPAVVETQRAAVLPMYEEYLVKGKISKAESARLAEEAQMEELAVERSATEAAARSKAEFRSDEAAISDKNKPARVVQENSKVFVSGMIGKTKTHQRKLVPSYPVKVVTSTQVSPEFAADAAILTRREAYLGELKQASYAFNPPSPIKAATPVTVYFWLAPLAEPIRLANELKAELLKMRPGETPQAEAGRIDWSPKMRATLTGENEDFIITPTTGNDFDGLKNPSATRRTEWSWDVKAKHIGKELPLHLKVFAVLPNELGEPQEVLKLDKLIHVEVTWRWLVDEHEEDLKWILGGLGTALVGAIGAWWKSRQSKISKV
jgi:hypothetical protein